MPSNQRDEEAAPLMVDLTAGPDEEKLGADNWHLNTGDNNNGATPGGWRWAASRNQSEEFIDPRVQVKNARRRLGSLATAVFFITIACVGGYTLGTSFRTSRNQHAHIPNAPISKHKPSGHDAHTWIHKSNNLVLPDGLVEGATADELEAVISAEIEQEEAEADAIEDQLEESPNALDVSADMELLEEEEEEQELLAEEAPKFEDKQPLEFDKPRVLILTGLYGFSERPWQDLFRAACSGGVKCERLCAISNPDYLYNLDVPKFNEKRAEALAELKSLRTDTLYFVDMYGSCEGQHDSGSFTFPPTEIHINSRDHPDLMDLEALGIEARVEMRFIVPIARDIEVVAKGMLEHAPFMNLFHLMQALDMQLHALSSMLRQMRHESYRLFDPVTATLGSSKEDEEAAQEGLDLALDEWLGIHGASRYLRFMQSVLLPSPSIKVSAGAKEFLTDAAPVLSRTWARAEQQKAESEWEIIRKTPPSDTKPRLIFFAGLEGTGHHLWRMIMTNLIRQKQLARACKITSLLYNQKNHANLWHCDSVASFVSAKEKLLTAMQDLDPNESLNYLGNLLDPKQRICPSKSGMMSYPNFGGPNKNAQRPNLITLAAAAEKAGVDLRIVLLLRKAEAVISSTVDHRHFAAEGNEVRMLESNAQGLLAQLDAIDPKFVTACVSFEDHDLNYMSDMEHTLGTTGETQKLYFKIANPNATFSKQKGDRPNPKAERRKVYLNTLRTTTEKIDSLYCN